MTNEHLDTLTASIRLTLHETQPGDDQTERVITQAETVVRELTTLGRIVREMLAQKDNSPALLACMYVIIVAAKELLNPLALIFTEEMTPHKFKKEVH